MKCLNTYKIVLFHDWGPKDIYIFGDFAAYKMKQLQFLWDDQTVIYLHMKFQEKDEVRRITYWNSFSDEATQRGK